MSASSLEPELLCCARSRIRSIALTTARVPVDCSSTEQLISCVISFRRVVARAICEEPADCSFVAPPISWANLIHLCDNVGDLLERPAEFAIQVQAFVDDVRALVHVGDGFPRFLLDALELSSEISLAERADFSDNLRTSSATTANPRPCSPARAASMAAFRASRFVCSAKSSMTSIILSTSSARWPSKSMIFRR